MEQHELSDLPGEPTDNFADDAMAHLLAELVSDWDQPAAFASDDREPALVELPAEPAMVALCEPVAVVAEPVHYGTFVEQPPADPPAAVDNADRLSMELLEALTAPSPVSASPVFAEPEQQAVAKAAEPEAEPAEDAALLSSLLSEQPEPASSSDEPADDVARLAEAVQGESPVAPPAESLDLDSEVPDLSALLLESEIGVSEPAAEQSPEEPGEDFANKEKVVLFSLAGARYAIGIQQIVETDRIPQVTRVPHTPDFVRGVVNLRGDILALIDLRTLWGLPPLEPGKQGRLLVIRDRGEKVTTGLVVDDVSGIAPIDLDSFTSESEVSPERAASLLRGVYRRQQQPLHVLDVEKLLLTPELQQLTAN